MRIIAYDRHKNKIKLWKIKYKFRLLIQSKIMREYK